MSEKEQVEFASLKIHADLTQKIDEMVEKSRTFSGTPRYRSRAAFVEEAVEEKLEREAKG